MGELGGVRVIVLVLHNTSTSNSIVCMMFSYSI